MNAPNRVGPVAVVPSAAPYVLVMSAPFVRRRYLPEGHQSWERSVPDQASVDVPRLPGDVAGLVGPQPDDQVADIVRFVRAAQRDGAVEPGLRILGRDALAI